MLHHRIYLFAGYRHGSRGPCQASSAPRSLLHVGHLGSVRDVRVLELEVVHVVYTHHCRQVYWNRISQNNLETINNTVQHILVILKNDQIIKCLLCVL